MRPRAYLETTVFSLLAARPSRRILVAAHQELTHKWWELRRHMFELHASELVAAEVEKGHSDAARRRMSYLSQCHVLGINEEALQLAESLVRTHCIPQKAAPNPLHVALSAVNALDYLITWNCTHINNATQKKAIESTCEGAGYRCPVICTPEELM